MRTIKRGDRGEEVRAWQRALKLSPVDASFGFSTHRATVAFQQAHQLTPDGIVGPKTWAAAGIIDPVETDTGTHPKWPTQSGADSFYGNPRGTGGGASPTWENANLVQYIPPWKMSFEGKPIRGITVHRKCRDSIARVFDRAWEMYGKSQEEIEKHHLHDFSGSYVFRNIRGSNRLSMHSYGCAIDIAAGLNGLGKPYDPERGLPMEFVKLFEDEGWTWGGRWRGRPDAMHFQAASVS